MRWHSEVHWSIGGGGAVFWFHRIAWYRYYLVGHIISSKSPFPRSTLSLNSKCQTQQLAPLSLNHSWHSYHCQIWLQCQWAAWHVTTHPVVLGTAFHRSISAAVPPDEARFDSQFYVVTHRLSSLYGATSSPELNTRSEHNLSWLQQPPPEV